MSPFVVIVAAVIVANAAWWRYADVRLRNTRRARLWRILLAIFMGYELGYLAFFICFPHYGRNAHAWVPAAPLAAIYLWHLLVLPATVLAIVVIEITRRIARLAPPPLAISQRQTGALFTRREALIALPPLLTAVATARGVRQIHDFRINRLDVPITDLPRALDGLTIAQVSDIHIGRFTRAAMLPKIIDATNNLRADLVLLTGDLIDLSLSDLPTGIDFVRKLDARHGLFMIEGNHDLIDSPIEFETRVRAASLPLLLNESQTIVVRGHSVQILGMTWSHRDSTIVGSLAQLLPQRKPDAFPILLAHHPHAFDSAAAVGLPLVLSGHTHGGQLMLNERLGAGPVMFRYWSGLYRKVDSALVVSNGVGNWFPLRFHAPAEITHITLRAV